jgi:geranylgeranyl diphosphate synthase type I
VAQQAVHVARGWRGSPARYGESVATLVGDLGHSYARRLLRGLPVTVTDLWDELEAELVVGQYLDVAGTATSDVDLEDALRIAELKSARYTIMRPLALGAACAGCTETPEPLVEYGLSVGLAFQLRDDLLGAVGATELTGKPVGDDLREGKPTALVAIARERASSSETAVLGTIGTDDVDVDQVLGVLHDTGAVQEVERQVQICTSRGIGALEHEGGDLHRPTVDLLVEVALELCARTA